MVYLGIILILLGLLLSRQREVVFEKVTTRLHFGSDCRPKVIGIAPGWAKPGTPNKIIFGIDPETGCSFLTRDFPSLPIVNLKDPQHIQEFIALNTGA